MSEDAFFIPVDATPGRRRFETTSHASGPWDPRAQHGGPPSALVAHVLDADHPRPELRLVRLTVEILRPVPVAPLASRTWVIREGRKVQHLGASLSGPDGREVVTATAWRIRTADVDLGVAIEGEPFSPGPDDLQSAVGFFRELDPTVGYVGAMDVRFAAGDWADFDTTRTLAWLRARYPLVAGSRTSPAERVLIAADSGNGVSARFDGLFINPDLTVQWTRPAVGEWVGLEASTTLTDDGIGLATSVIHDQHGPLGRGAQTLLLDHAPPD